MLLTVVSLATTNIEPAKLTSQDYVGTYNVVATESNNVVNVKITADNIIEHKNAEDEYGYWVGFAVPAPEGVDKMTWTFGDDSATEVGLEPNVTADGKSGIAFYVDASNPKTTATLQWLSGSETVDSVITYDIDLDVTLKLPEVKAAKLNLETQPTGYMVTGTSTGVTEVDVVIEAENVVEHINEDASPAYGYWLGFALEAPDGATGASYEFGETKGTNCSLEANVTEEGKDGIAFYVDVANPKQKAKIAWVYPEGEGKTITYNIDVSKVTPKVAKAKLASDDYAKNYEVSSEFVGNNKIDVTITAKDVVRHINEATSPVYGYWLGFALEAPKDATGVSYEFGETKGTNCALEANVVGEGTKGLAVYVDAVNPKSTAKVTWVYGNVDGNEITYNIDLSEVTLKSAEVLVEKAILKSETYATDYTVTGVENGNAIDVTITAKDVVKHANEANPAVEGYWLGFALKAPEGATGVKYKFVGENEVISPLEERVTTNGDKGLAVYVDAANPKKQIEVKWIYNGVDANIIVYNIAVNVTYTVTFNANGHGSAPATKQVPINEKVTKPTNPTASGYTFGGWFTESACTNAYDFNAPVTEKVELFAKWTKQSSSSGGGGGGSADIKTYKITVTEGKNGSISPDGTVKVEKGDNQKFKIKADKGYEIEDVIVDGKSVGAVESYTFKNVKAKHTIKATFKKIEEKDEEVEEEEKVEEKPQEKPNQSNKKYTDVKADAWYATPIEYVTRNNLMNGVGNDKFSPSNNGTRAMIVTILYNKEGKPSVIGNTSFKDVTKGAWYEGPIAWAKANNIANGYEDGTFGPSKSVTREQLAVMLYNYAQTKGTVTMGTAELKFDDNADIHAWAQEAMKWCVSNKIINGKGNNKLDPRGLATRAEIATIIMNFCEM